MKNPFKNTFQITSSFSYYLSKFLIKIFSFILFYYTITVADMDASHPWQVGFQDPATPIMEGIIFFNGLLMTFMIFIACLVGWLLYKSLTLFDESVHNNPVGFTHSTLLEVVWTIIPAVILMIISVPSYNLLYAMDEVIDPSLTIKVVGHQWYWSYECSDFEVAPHLQKVDSVLVKDNFNELKSMVESIELCPKEAEKGETQTLLTIANDFLNVVENEIGQLNEEASNILARRIDYFKLLLMYHESSKESYSPLEEQGNGGVAGIIASMRNDLETTKLLPEQKEAVINFLKTFKQYLRVTEEDKLEDVRQSLSKQLFLSSESSLSDKQGSDDSKSSGFDDSDDDGSIVSDLTEFDLSNPNWEWCELVSVKEQYERDELSLRIAGLEAFSSKRRCNNAAALLFEEDDTPFLELVNKMNKDAKELSRVVSIADLSEDKLLDARLIDHQLRLTRAEREGFSSKYALDTAIFASNFADHEFKVALEELNNAKYYSHWSNIELAAAKVNKLTAKYLQAEASLGVTDPLFIRSSWINQKGYYSWHRFLRLAAKNLSEPERLIFLNADEELNGANSLLEKAQRNLTVEEQTRSNAIADNAKAEFMAMERETISAIEEFERGKIILANAEADFKSFQDISNRAAIRLEKAETALSKVKHIADRAKARLNAVEKVYETAQSKLTGVKITSESVDVSRNLKEAQNKFSLIKEEFDKTLLDLESSKLELFVAEDRLKTVKTNLNKTEKVFENTGILEIQTPVKGKPDKPKEYYPNYLWEIHKEDLAFVKAQLKADIAELEEARKSVDLAESRLSAVGGQLLEGELNQSKALIEVLKEKPNNLDSLNEEINHVSGIELGLAEAIYVKAQKNFEFDNSKICELVLRRAEKGLLEAKIKGGNTSYLKSFLQNNFENLDSNKLISDYAELCVINSIEELIDAEKDYEKASDILKKAKSILEKVTFDLSKDYDNPYLETVRYLHKNTSLSLDNSLKQLELTKAEFSPLDIKMKPGLLQSKSYKEVVLAKAELANIKWLAARVAKTLNIPLNEEVKPFNVQFSHLSEESSSKSKEEDSSSFKAPDDKDPSKSKEEDSSSFEAPDDKDPSKSKEEIKEILSKLDDIKFSQNSAGFKNKLIHIFSQLSKTLDSEESSKIALLVDKALGSIVTDEDETNQELRRQIGYVEEEASFFKEAQEADVEPINFDSYLIADDDLVIPKPGGTGKAGKVFRLLEVDNRLFVPTNTHIRLLVTSADVLHSWAVPSLGIKVDACPGRLNQVFLFVKREGVFYGQCSELCGVNHGFMPIVVQAVSQDEYLTWVGKRLCS